MSRIFGPEFLTKQTYLQQTDIFTETFGRRVWDALNNRTVLFNAIPKVGWGPTFGWRLRSDRDKGGDNNSRPMTETGALPQIGVSNYVNLGSAPKIPSTAFGVSLKSQFMGGLEGGIGDALAVEQEAKMRDHVKEINLELTKNNHARITAVSSTTVTVAPAADAGNFNVGDTVQVRDVSGSGAYLGVDSVVSAINTTTGVITTATDLSTTTAAADILFVSAREGVTSIADIVAEGEMNVAHATLGNIRPRIYNIAVGSRGTKTSAAHLNAANVSGNNGTGRDLTIKLVDDSIEAIRNRGGLMGQGLIWTGHDQYFNLERLFQAQQRFIGYQTVSFGVGDERTYPGTQVNMELATYMGIPILADADAPKSVPAAGTTSLGSDLFVLDLDHLELAVAIPTQYVENRNYWVSNALAVQGLLFTFLELRARRIDVHARVYDLNA
jgi:hypothetical protein